LERSRYQDRSHRFRGTERRRSNEGKLHRPFDRFNPSFSEIQNIPATLGQPDEKLLAVQV